MAFLASLLPFLVSAGGSIGGGLLSKGNNKETRQQRTSRKTADELLASIRGNGPFSDLFNTSDEAFQKSYVDPAKSMFNNQIAPQIQQQFIANGQQGGTALNDTLSRAGVDLDSNLNQQYMQFKQGGQDRMTNMLNSILGMGQGAASPLSYGQAAGQGLQGFMNSDVFGDLIKNMSGTRGLNAPQYPPNLSYQG